MMKQGYGAFAQVYDELMDFDYPALTAFYETVFQQFGCKPKSLLDLACGTGKVTALMAQKGYDMVGADASAEMLSMAYTQTADQEGVLLLCQPMQELDLNDTVDGALCALDGINHLATVSDLQETFRRVALFTNPGGLFIFDVHSLSKMKKTLGQNTFVYDTKNCFCVWQNHWVASAQRIDYNLQMFIRQQSGSYRRQSESFSEYYYSPEMLSELLQKAGFEMKLITAGQTLEPWTGQPCERHFIIARKPNL